MGHGEGRRTLYVKTDMVVDMLKNARDLMNDSGRHWIKGEYYGHKKGEQAYCSVGALRKSGSRRPAAYRSSIIALATVIDPDRMKSSREHALKHSLDVNRHLASVAESIIVNWNDHPNRRWLDVDRKFRKAIKLVIGK